MSRTFSKVSVVESSAFEKLINEADVSDYDIKATCTCCFFFNSNISWERSQLVHRVKIFLWISIQVHLICGYHQAAVRQVVVCFQYSFE
jgi:DNA mismatch repair protein MutH